MLSIEWFGLEIVENSIGSIQNIQFKKWGFSSKKVSSQKPKPLSYGRPNKRKLERAIAAGI